MMKQRNKPEISLKPEKQPETALDFENIFFSFATELQKTLFQPRAQLRRVRKTRLQDRFAKSESWPERDKLCRSLAAKCYSIANAFDDANPDKLKYLRLAAKFLGLSFTPKKLEDLQTIQKEVAAIKAQLKEQEAVDEEDDLGEN